MLTVEEIPSRWEDIDARWMARVLAARFPEAEVTGVALTWCSDGSNRRATFDLEYGRGEGPARVFVKRRASTARCTPAMATCSTRRSCTPRA